jgi:hypothetical protein
MAWTAKEITTSGAQVVVFYGGPMPLMTEAWVPKGTNPVTYANCTVTPAPTTACTVTPPTWNPKQV